MFIFPIEMCFRLGAFERSFIMTIFVHYRCCKEMRKFAQWSLSWCNHVHSPSYICKINSWTVWSNYLYTTYQHGNSKAYYSCSSWLAWYYLFQRHRLFPKSNVEPLWEVIHTITVRFSYQSFPNPFPQVLPISIHPQVRTLFPVRTRGWLVWR